MCNAYTETARIRLIIKNVKRFDAVSCQKCHLNQMETVVYFNDKNIKRR